MKPTEFEQSNVVIAKNQPQYLPLPAFASPPSEPSGKVITCWDIGDADEMKDILLRGHIWLSQLTFHRPFQPVQLSARSFFVDDDGRPVDKLPPRNVLALAEVRHDHYSTVADIPDPEALAKRIMALAEKSPEVAELVGYISRMVRDLESPDTGT